MLIKRNSHTKQTYRGFACLFCPSAHTRISERAQHWMTCKRIRQWPLSGPCSEAMLFIVRYWHLAPTLLSLHFAIQAACGHLTAVMGRVAFLSPLTCPLHMFHVITCLFLGRPIKNQHVDMIPHHSLCFDALPNKNSANIRDPLWSDVSAMQMKRKDFSIFLKKIQGRNKAPLFIPLGLDD